MEPQSEPMSNSGFTAWETEWRGIRSESLKQRSQVSLYSNAECQLYHSKQRCGGKFRKIYNKILKVFPALLVEGVVPAGRERWSDAETYSHAWTALSMITFSLWKLALQSKLRGVSYSDCFIFWKKSSSLYWLLLNIPLYLSNFIWAVLGFWPTEATFSSLWSCVGLQSNTCIVCSMQACADVQIILTHCIPGCIFIELEEIWH